MITKRIIPCLDVDKGRVVKGVRFIDLKDAGDPTELARFYYEEGADELVFLDISASSDNRKTMIEVVKNVAKEIFIPFTVGGGIRSVEDIKNILLAGADKVAINTAAIVNPSLIADGANIFGNQCIVVAIDVKKMGSVWEVFINGGKTPTGINVYDWAQKAVAQGAGELLLTSMDRDGTEDGYDCGLMQLVSSAVTVPVIASGGAGKKEDFIEVFTKGKADAALVASLFHFQKLNIKNIKEYLRINKIPVRE